MEVYDLLARLFPRSFTAKLFFIAFVGTHLPLIALVTWVLAVDALPDRDTVLVLVLAATVFGTAATLAAIQALLRPIYRVEQALGGFERTGEIAPLPDGYADEVGRLMGQAGRLMRRVSDRIAATQRSADTDPLTGLLNRRGFDRAIADRGDGAVIHFDLDHFKSVNDSFGHDAGDEVLRQVAAVAAGVLRRGDLLARFGGEEFVAFLPGADRSAAQAVAERLRAAIRERISLGGRAVTVSVGVSQGTGAALGELLSHADAATYASKRGGRDRVTLAWAG